VANPRQVRELLLALTYVGTGPAHVFNRLIGCLYHCLQTGQALRRNHRLPSTVSSAKTRCRLTVSKIGGLWIEIF
jgi:hypothetical protein